MTQKEEFNELRKIIQNQHKKAILRVYPQLANKAYIIYHDKIIRLSIVELELPDVITSHSWPQELGDYKLFKQLIREIIYWANQDNIPLKDEIIVTGVGYKDNLEYKPKIDKIYLTYREARAAYKKTKAYAELCRGVNAGVCLTSIILFGVGTTLALDGAFTLITTIILSLIVIPTFIITYIKLGK